MRGLEQGVRTVMAPPGALATAGITVPMPESERQLALSVTLRLVADGTAGNRSVVVAVTDGSGQAIARSVSGFAQTPSSTADYSFSTGLGEWDSDLATVASGPLFDVPLSAGDTISVTVAGAGVADAISRLRVVLWQVTVRDDEEA